VAPRSARFALVGAAVVGTAALLVERSLPFTERVYRRRGTGIIRDPPRTHVLGFELSPTEGVVWFVVVGVLAGALLGLFLARVLRWAPGARWRTLGAASGGVVGLAASLARPTYCLGGSTRGFDAVFVCPYKSLFAWDAAPILADAVWSVLGAIVGIVLGSLLVRLRWDGSVEGRPARERAGKER
jgi:hypothetical protein